MRIDARFFILDVNDVLRYIMIRIYRLDARQNCQFFWAAARIDLAYGCIFCTLFCFYLSHYTYIPQMRSSGSAEPARHEAEARVAMIDLRQPHRASGIWLGNRE